MRGGGHSRRPLLRLAALVETPEPGEANTGSCVNSDPGPDVGFGGARRTTKGLYKVKMELRTEIEIHSSPEQVWDILTNFERLHEWNPFITQMQGELREGATLAVTLAPPEADEITLKTVVLAAERPRQLRWRDTRGFAWLFAREHFFELIELESGRTRLVHGQDLTGYLVKFLGPMVTRLARGSVLMNQSLKRRSEVRS